jgi:hypothetical protein
MGGLDPPIQHYKEGIDCSLDGRIKCGHDDKGRPAMTWFQQIATRFKAPFALVT